MIAERVKAVRAARGLTGAQLAQKMTETGLKWDRSVVANLENGRRSTVSVEELLALAFVLEVAPVHLIVPLDDDGWLAVTPDVSTTNPLARAWIRGAEALPWTDERRFYSEVPESEFTRRAEQQQEWEQRMVALGIMSKSEMGPADAAEDDEP